jgi:hypothetical protein
MSRQQRAFCECLAADKRKAILESRWVMAEILDIGGKQKCAHSQCLCEVASFEKYCSDYCSDADEEKEVEIQCDCKHPPCALD